MSRIVPVKTIDRILYPDALRVLAIVAVVTSHVSAPFLHSASLTSVGWMIANVADSLTRWAVPVFLMVSGIFLLDVDRSFEIRTFYKKNMVRLLTAYLFWDFIYQMITTKGSILLSIESVVLSRPHYHLEFLLYMMGLYVVVPVLRGFIKNATRREYIYYISVWIIASSIFPLGQQFAPEQIRQVFIMLSARINFNFFINYTGYLILGQYLHRFPITGRVKTTIYVIGGACGLWTITSTTVLSRIAGHLDTTFFAYKQLNVILMSVAVFIFVKSFVEKKKSIQRYQREITALSACAFGVYLIHVIFLILFSIFDMEWMRHSYAIPVVVILICVLSFTAIQIWRISYIAIINHFRGLK